MRSSPQNISRSSALLKEERQAKGRTSSRPARKASSCWRTPLPNQKRVASCTNSGRRSGVTASSSPPGQRAAPARPVSKKQAPEALRKSPSARPPRPGSPSAEAPLARAAAASARRPQSSPAQPSPGRGKLWGPRASPWARRKKSSARGSGTMKPSRRAWPMRRPKKRKRRQAASRLGPGSRGRGRRPWRGASSGASGRPSSSTQSGVSLLASRPCSARATST
mmetsp:Transcript_59881/g.185584  ORF Transcript_59881/g.185584 Transcript_59881/m.185584 type:complete len:223 (+) Transcript_59881:541-1209(+)